MTTSRNWTKPMAARAAALGVAALLAAGGLSAATEARAGGFLPMGGKAVRETGAAALVQKVDWRSRGRGHGRRDHYKPRHYEPRHYRPRRGRPYRYVYRRHGDGDLGAAIAGFALGIVTYHVLDTPASPPPAPATYQWTTPPTITGVAQPAVTSVGPLASCRMTREYQTRVLIGGTEHDAYGTACLQPDGSWRLGPPNVL